MQYHGCIVLFKGVSEIGQRKHTKTQKTHTHMRLKSKYSNSNSPQKNISWCCIWKMVNLKDTVDGSEILHQLSLVVYPMIYKVLAPSQVVNAGFLPSTVLDEVSSLGRLLATSSVEHVLPGETWEVFELEQKIGNAPRQAWKAKTIESEREMWVYKL